jgi:hypothetical protein
VHFVQKAANGIIKWPAYRIDVGVIYKALDKIY